MKRTSPWILLAAIVAAVLMVIWLPSSVGYATGCGGNGAELRGPNGTFGISESEYENNMRCSWKIQFEINKLVQLHFVNFDLEDGSSCRYDNVRIYDGHDTSAPLLHTFCGSSLPGDVRSSGNTMSVYFNTDDGGTRNGFSIYYSEFRPFDVAGCGGNGVVLHGPNGKFGISESQYGNNMICSWKIQVEVNKVVQLNFGWFDLQAGSSCRYDNITIYDGSDTSAPLLHTFCGSSLPDKVRSSGNTIIVYFATDDSGTSDGFNISYAASIPLEGCDGNGAVLRGTSGTFGLRESRYEETIKCSWKIQVEVEKVVQLHFLSFDLKDDYSYYNSLNLEIYDGNNTSASKLHSFNGRSLPDDVTSSGNAMFVYLKTRNSGTRLGFNIYYSEIMPVDGCLGSPAEMTGHEGTFGISDGQNTRYMACRWNIQVDPSKVVQLHFLNFDLGASTDCSSANVTVYDGNYYRWNDNLWLTVCGRDLPGDYTRSSNEVNVAFKIINVTAYEGFQIHYTGLTRVEGCYGYPAVMTHYTGTFGIGHEQNLTYINIRCRWKIYVETTKLVQLHFLNFDLGATSNCSSTSVKVYDGSNTSAPLLHTFCGRSLPDDVRSSSNTMFVDFKIYNVTKYEGFKSYYSALIPIEGCIGSPVEMTGNTGTFGTAEQDLMYISMTCRWKIRVEPSKRVQLHFLNFTLGASSNCTSTSIRIYDGSDTSAPLLHTFCGRTLPGDVIGSGNTMFVYFETGNATTYNGFRIYYSGLIPVEGCLGSPAKVTGHNGTVGVSDGQNTEYMTCMWKIRVEPSKLVQMHFLNLYLGSHRDSDYNYYSYRRQTPCVKTYDGGNTSAPVLNTFCGRSLPDNFTSSGNTVFVVFKIDNVNTYEGFKIYYSALNQIEGCIGSPAEIRGSKGIFGINGDQYYSAMRCIWKIQVEHSKRVKLHFLSLDVYKYEYIKIYDGSDTSAPLLHTICGNTLPDDVRSTGNTIAVYFTASRSDSRSRFRVYYSAFMPVEGCTHSPVEIMGPSGTFGVSKYQYRNDMRCRWNLHVDQSKRVRLHFLLFDVENCTKCLCDSLAVATVEEMTTPVTHSFCGSIVPDDINTDTNKLLVYFRTDGSKSLSGFRIYYSDKLPVQGCLGNPVTKHGPKGTFGVDTSHYDNYMACGWKIQVQVFKRVHLRFLSFELEASTGCTFDNVKVYDGSDTSAPLLHTFCGSNLPDDIRSTGNTIYVQFTTDDTSIYGGFSVYYSAFTTVDGCHGTPVKLRGPSGAFGISDGQNHNDMRCSWKIQVDPSKRVQLQFLSLQLGKSTGCRKESVNIYDGDDTTAALIHTFCGNTIPGDITSSANTVFVHFSSSDNSSIHSGFKIYYSDLAAPTGCHDKVTTLRGPRGSFGVTQPQYTNYMRCSWKIQVNSTNIVKLEFDEFSVESCCDSVKVYDGSNRAAPLLGTFYGSALPSDVISTNSTISVYFESDGSGTWDGFNINYTALPLARTDCQPGEMFDGQKCAKCPRGTYQPGRGKTACIHCPLNHTTRNVGSNNVADCQFTGGLLQLEEGDDT